MYLFSMYTYVCMYACYIHMRVYPCRLHVCTCVCSYECTPLVQTQKTESMYGMHAYIVSVCMYHMRAYSMSVCMYVSGVGVMHEKRVAICIRICVCADMYK